MLLWDRVPNRAPGVLGRVPASLPLTAQHLVKTYAKLSIIDYR